MNAMAPANGQGQIFIVPAQGGTPQRIQPSFLYARYPIWAWHHSSPGALRHAELVRFELSAEAQLAKSRAIRCFASQLETTSAHAVMPAHVLGYFSRPYEAFLR